MAFRVPPQRSSRTSLELLSPRGSSRAPVRVTAGLQPVRLRALHDVATSLARRPEVVEFASELVRGRGRGRLARVASVLTFVSQLTSHEAEGEPRDGVDALVCLAGEDEGPAVILTALLRALGERASIRRGDGRTWVEVALELEDVARLPPHARLRHAGTGFHIPLDAARSRALGWLALQSGPRGPA